MWAGHRRRSDEHLGADVVSCRLGLEVGACGGRRKPLLALLSRRCANSWQQEGLSQADPGSSSLMFSCKGFGSQQLIGKKSLQRMLGITTLEHILSGITLSTAGAAHLSTPAHACQCCLQQQGWMWHSRILGKHAAGGAGGHHLKIPWHEGLPLQTTMQGHVLFNT